MHNFVRALCNAATRGKMPASARERNQKVTAAVTNKRGETHVDSGVKILIAVVVGAILMTGVVLLFNKTIFPSAGDKIGSLFDQADVTNGPWSGDVGSGGSGGETPGTNHGAFPIKWNTLAVKDNANIAVTSPDGSVAGDQLTSMSDYFCKITSFAPTKEQLTRTEMKLSTSQDTWYPIFVNNETVPGAVLVKYSNGKDDIAWGLSVSTPGTYDLSAAYTLINNGSGSVTGEVASAGFYCLNYAKATSGEGEPAKSDCIIDLEAGCLVANELIDNMVVYDESTGIYYANSKDTLDAFHISTSAPYSLDGLPSDYRPDIYDRVYYGDYRYTYKTDTSWVPRVIDATKTRYTAVAKTLFGHDIVMLKSTFYQCTNMAAAPQFPDTVTDIEYETFYKCSSMTTASLPAGVTSLGKYAFYKCFALQSLIIPDGVTYIGEGAFYECSSLTTVQMPKSLEIIGEEAFAKCSKLNGITLHNNVTTIGSWVFYKCASLTDIAIPNGVTIIESFTFAECSNLTNVTLPRNLETIGEKAFYKCKKMPGISMPATVTSIGPWAFYDCESITNVSIPSGVTLINECAFAECSSLTNVTLANGLVTIGDKAFYKCTSMTNVTLPESLTSIGIWAFYGCETITEITIPSSVVSIGAYAFSDCDSMTSATFANTEGWYVTQIENEESGTDIGAGVLADRAATANLLKETYADRYYWYRKVV